MRDIITTRLNSIAAEHNIRIMYACESGSRAWGFPSPDSDWDVRFIYLRSRNYYLSVAERNNDQLSFPINDELDVYGWDLRKVLRLMLGANVTPLEWIQSPIVYQQSAGFREALWTLCPHHFSQRANTHHYLGIARGAMEGMEADGSIKIKKLFYVLRPLLAAKWCLERNTISPMEIGPMLSLLPDDLRKMVSELIALKRDAAEGFVIRADESLKMYIQEEMAQCSIKSAELDKHYNTVERVDEFFRTTLEQYEHSGA